MSFTIPITDKRLAHEMFTAEVVDKVDNGKGYWNYLKIGVFYNVENGGKIQLGEYTRNYSNLYRTFYPFKIEEQYYALYSKDYTASSVMTLPDCKDWCGESGDTFGFCPVEFYVPKDDWNKYDWSSPKYEGKFAHRRNRINENIPFGLVAGCVWGDDSSWKIQLLDLRGLKDKKLVRSERFGYCWLKNNHHLKDAIKYVNHHDFASLWEKDTGKGDEYSIELCSVRDYSLTDEEDNEL